MTEEYTGRISARALDVVRTEGRRVTDLDRRQSDKAAFNRLRIAERDAIYRVARPERNISAAKEYRTQLSRTLGRSDRKAAAKAFAGRHPKAIAADKKIAQKMFVAGYSPQEIQRAMRCGSPACARMSPAAFNAYYRKQIQPAIRNRKVQRQRQKMALFKQRHGVPQSYKRMDGIRQLQARERQQAPTRMRPDPIQRSHTGYTRKRWAPPCFY
ncbi:hypothetical protein PN498_13320 [Oscillatoria sp. CS-180]|uniref:hypothetical protein n=1 Tax=Oscillatoria sp. CS-180 TaxID=3021720 RepID=UPI0023302241|nr:hypothetical protein [Oscillatoria sp. CS-180]MDB9526974.1 hypothetical protein [Oscillatoria sp. CS-180]